MPTLSTATDEELQVELERRKQKSAERIYRLEAPELSTLSATLERHIDDIMKGDDVDSDWRAYIYEAVINAFYGKNFWQWRKNFPR